MEDIISRLLLAIKSRDENKIRNLYHHASLEEKANCLKFLYKSAKTNDAAEHFYQDVTAYCLKDSDFPEKVLQGINTLDKFSFFCAPMAFAEQLCVQDAIGNNVLHYLLSNTPAEQPAFNYLRTLMHFESKELLQTALCARNNKHLTPIECYLAYNPPKQPLAIQELSAFLALCEVENRLKTPETTSNLKAITNFMKNQGGYDDYQRFLVATYYQVNSDDLCRSY
ncbi:hypothetical protein ACSLBF_13545 [Pseudoalteromonas sp. T1lg65]|uniref:hypothetical protein n=1 Tax=Pseudoalteromonas sp. T1lg65 TaxID=2077101 RepID=UPI003F7A9AD7